MLTKYILFAGAPYYPIGGWLDAKGMFYREEQARSCFRRVCDEMDRDYGKQDLWGHIVCFHDLDWQIVSHGVRKVEWAEGVRFPKAPVWKLGPDPLYEDLVKVFVT